MDDQTARQLLHDERTRIEGIRNGLLSQRLVGPDVATDRFGEPSDLPGSDEIEREVEQATLAALDADRLEIDRALARVRIGTYGTCESCGEPIADERLEAMPAARRCAAHAERLDVLDRSATPPPGDADALSGRIALANLDLVGSDDDAVGPTDGTDDGGGAEEAAVHVEPAST